MPHAVPRPSRVGDEAETLAGCIQAARGPLATLIQMSDVHLIRVDGEDDDGGRSDDLTTTLLAVQALGTDSATETCLIGRKLTILIPFGGFVQSSRR